MIFRNRANSGDFDVGTLTSPTFSRDARFRFEHVSSIEIVSVGGTTKFSSAETNEMYVSVPSPTTASYSRVW